MKIAICYSGNVRTFEHCVLSHSRLFQNADVYFSVWDDFGRVEKINDAIHHKIDLNLPHKVSENYLTDKTPSNFCIKGIKIDSYSVLDNSIELKKDNHLKYQYYKTRDAYGMIPNNAEEYDIVVRLRCDITIENFHHDTDTIVFNKDIWYNLGWSPEHQLMNEMIWVANPDLMARSVRMFDNLEYLNSTLTMSQMYGESVFYFHLVKENLLPYASFFDFNYNIIR